MFFRNSENFNRILNLLLPKDGKWHDIQIINNELYIDGKFRMSTDPEGTVECFILERSLSDEDIKVLKEGIT